MIDLLPELSFGDNLRPSQVTPKLREELAGGERRRRNQLALAASILMFVSSLVLFAQVPDDARAFTPFARIVGLETSVLAVFVLAIFLTYSRRISFCHEAEVTSAAIMDKQTTALWALGAGRWSSWATPTARTLREALNMEDDGTNGDVPHIITLRLRFVPGSPDTHLDWSALRDEIPHCDVTKRACGGGWGTFMGGLKQGALVALLYSPGNPKCCRIVQRFASHGQIVAS